MRAVRTVTITNGRFVRTSDYECGGNVKKVTNRQREESNKLTNMGKKESAKLVNPFLVAITSNRGNLIYGGCHIWFVASLRPREMQD